MGNLTIRQKIAIHTLLTNLAGLVLLGLLIFTVYKETILEYEVEVLGLENLKSASNLRVALESVKSHALYLIGTPPIQGLMKARENDGYDDVGASTEVQWKKILETLFRQTIKTYPEILQVRFILGNGQEYLKLNNFGDSKIVTEPERSLQNKSNREYFIEASKVSAGSVSLSRFDLNREFGKIEVPYRPVLRAASPIFNSKKELFGMVVVNADAGWILERFRTESGNRTAFIVDEKGDYLLHPDSRKAFRFEFEKVPGLANDDPELFARIEKAGNSGSTTSLVSYVRENEGVNFSIVPLQEDGFIALINKFSTLPLSEKLSKLKKEIFLFGLLTLAISLLVTMFFSRTITAPLSRLTQAVSRFPEEDIVSELPVEAEGEVGELASTIKDMAERIQQAGKVRQKTMDLVVQANVELEKNNKDLESFAYSASHDLRSPLQGINKIVRMLREDPDSSFSEDAQEKLDLLTNRASRMRGLLDSLLEYAKTGKDKLEPENINTTKLVQDVIELASLPEGFSVAVKGELPEIYSHKVLLEKVFLNLIGNAIKHHDKPTGKVEISGRVDGRKVLFSVKDDGPGIPPKYRGKIFEIFQTLRPRDEVEGSGMGLAIVKKTIEDLGGEIEVRASEGGRGSDFVFWISAQ